MSRSGADSQGAAHAAAELRERGNQLFRAQRFAEAAETYREAMVQVRAAEAEVTSLRPGSAPGASAELGRAVRLNLATCLVRLQEGLGEAIRLCDEVLEKDPSNMKAVFRRGAARHALARELPDPAQQRTALQAARRDLLAAAKAEPGDREVRVLFEQVTEDLRQMPVASAGPALGGLYDDREPTVPEPAPERDACPVCGRIDHTSCGRALWVAQRAQWLGVPVDEVARDPTSFEEEGTLAPLLRATRPAVGVAADTDMPDALSDLSDEEREMLEECLDATERPFPQLKRALPLTHAVHCAQELWAEDD